MMNLKLIYDKSFFHVVKETTQGHIFTKYHASAPKHD